MIDINDEVLRDAGIVSNHTAVRDSRSRSSKGEESGGNLALCEVCQVPEPEPRRSAVESLIPEGAITILFGDGGLGKSYVALYIATSVALGRPIAGKTVEKGRVLYLDAELDRDEFVRRAYSIARGLGLKQPPEGLYYARLTGSLMDPKVRNQAAALRRECNSNFVVVDSLTVGCWGIDPKDAKDVTPMQNEARVVQKDSKQASSEPTLARVLLRPAEVARMIGTSRSKVYELIASGALPSVRLQGGRLIRVPQAALERLATDAMKAASIDKGSIPALPERTR